MIIQETEEDGRCRFNCRTQKEAFFAGFYKAYDILDKTVYANFDEFQKESKKLTEIASEEFYKWKENQKDEK